MLVNFHDFLLSADFFRINFFKKNQKHYQSVKQFGSRSEMLSGDGISRKRVNKFNWILYQVLFYLHVWCENVKILSQGLLNILLVV